MTALVTPTVNFNGTPADDLVKQVTAICEALTDACEAMAAGMPHGRDYQTQDQSVAYEARNAFNERRKALAEMRDEFTSLAIAIDRQRR